MCRSFYVFKLTTKSSYNIFASISVILLVACISFSALAQAQRKPNVIYIYLDDMGYGELGCYGQQKIKTPNIDQLAAEGMLFTQHYTTFPVCAPARTGLLTGKHSGHCFIRGNYEFGGFSDDDEGGQMALPEGAFTIAQLMKQAGYATGAIGKWGLGMSNSTGDPNKQGFDYFYGYLDQKQAHNFYPTHLWENGKKDTLNNKYVHVHQPLPKDASPQDFDKFTGNDYSVTKMAEKTFAFIKSHKDEPFFLYLPYTGPHVSLQAPPEAVKEYIGQFDEQPYYGENGYAPCRYPLSTYAAMISYTDKQVGKIMALLKELNLDKNTIVMFSSDNGSTFNVGGVNAEFFNLTAGLRGRKMDLYEGGIRMPFIARWPGKIKAGQTSGLVSSQYDLMATLEELTNTKTDWRTDGISFLPTLLNQPVKQKKHAYLYFEYPEKSGQIAIRMDNWKGVKSDVKKNGKGSWELFDMLKDEKEITNLTSDHQDIIAQFESIIQKEHQTAVIREWEFIDPKFKQRN
jgi:arylsulfatase A